MENYRVVRLSYLIKNYKPVNKKDLVKIKK